MAAKSKRFMILALSDREKYGFNEETLPPLVALMESAKPDYLTMLFVGVTGYFITSARAINRVEKAIKDAENLRDSDNRFSQLGIGLAEGGMIADFDWWGRVKKSGIQPLGIAANEASRLSYLSTGYLEALKALKGQGGIQSS